MITINFNDDKLKIKNNLDELTIFELEELTNIILKTENNNYQQNYEILKYLGLGDYFLINIPNDDLVKIIENLTFLNNTDIKIKKSFKINNVKYSLKNNNFLITVKMFLLIETYLLRNPQKNMAEILAIVYQDNKEHNYDLNLIKNRAVVFRELGTADLIIPILNYINKLIIK